MQTIRHLVVPCGSSGDVVSRASLIIKRPLHLEELRRLCERRLESLDLLILYVDGMCFGEHQALVAAGVDAQGQKHVLGVAEGASEDSEGILTLRSKFGCQ